MMPSSPIHHRADTRHSGRLSPGSTPACVGPQDWPAFAPQIVWPNVQSARAPRHAGPRFDVKRSSRWPRVNLPDTHLAVKSP